MWIAGLSPEQCLSSPGLILVSVIPALLGAGLGCAGSCSTTGRGLSLQVLVCPALWNRCWIQPSQQLQAG